MAAFAFFGGYFLWREHDPRRARVWLAGGGGWSAWSSAAAQLLRGAHYPSHTLWSAWLCWTISAAAAHLPRLARLRPHPA